MTFSAGLFTALVGLGTAGTILLLIRRDRLAPGHSLWWMAVATCSVFLAFFPGIVDELGRLIGIRYPPILLVLLGLSAVLVKLLLMDLDRSRQERQIRILAQRLAVYERMDGQKRESD
ncbi:MAG: DUF2304 domain-containing protein [Deltaproteobacteria bacterium]|nr:DUF2304 domain-containing protein [Deltaproteobacteria bacterium]